MHAKDKLEVQQVQDTKGTFGFSLESFTISCVEIMNDFDLL